ncbi:hypothetical protein BGZ59_005548 [Podila verticillata]|nr:hypothetical protein BGZ59_005548 [Podila verticillata]
MVYLKLPLNMLTIELGDTLLDYHSDTLQTVKFFVKSFNEDDFLGVNSILAACSNLTSFSMHTGDSYRLKDSKSQLWGAEDIGTIPILRWTCSQLEILELTGMLPVFRKDDDAAKGSSKSNQDSGRDALACINGSQSTYQESVSEENNPRYECRHKLPMD